MCDAMHGAQAEREDEQAESGGTKPETCQEGDTEHASSTEVIQPPAAGTQRATGRSKGWGSMPELLLPAPSEARPVSAALRSFCLG